MNVPVWKTAKDLGVLASGSYFEKVIEAVSPGYSIVYNVISGSLPMGIQLTETGRLVGVPAIPGDETNNIVSFTVRARNSLGKLADRTFKLLISGVQAPTILSQTTDLGVQYDGLFFSHQLTALDEGDTSNLVWKFIRGRLPPGITLSKTGLLQGFFYQNKVEAAAFEKIGWDRLAWDRYMFDFIRQHIDTNYEFTVELGDGINYSRQTYSLKLIARELLTGDRTLRTVDETEVSVDHNNTNLPFITTMPQVLPQIKPETARQNTHFAFKFDALDLDGEEIYYEITSPDERGYDQDGEVGFDMDEYDSSEYPMPKYLGLNNQTGWYTGQLGKQVEHKEDYQFQIYARKAYSRDMQGYRSTFVVSALGQVDETISWSTGTNLGSINNGAVCILRVAAVHNAGQNLEYYIKSSGGRTPQGVKLQKNGMLSGRVTFEYFHFDNAETTIDNGKTTFDSVYTFTVVAQTANRSAYNEKTFTLTVNRVNEKPFENLYLKGFPNRDQRILFKSIMDRQDLFPDPLIYRLGDPYYGKASDLRFLFISGIETASVATYLEAMSRNHYNKTVLFGDVKTAVALDDNYNVQYEVVYLDVIDEQEGRDPVTRRPAAPSQTISLAKNKNKFMVNGQPQLELTPNALGNMSQRIEQVLGVVNPNTLPAWMTCPQLSSVPGHFESPLGYTRAVILAYTVPGASKLIAYRLKNANFTFNNIPFRTDRYQLDNYLSENFDLDMNRFIPGIETTVDIFPSVAERYREMGAVNYATTAAYDEINNLPLSVVRSTGSIDGVTNFVDGETLVFYQQDKFPSSVPGFDDNILKGVENKRSAVFRINIDQDQIVTLTKLRSTACGDVITIAGGITYANRRMNFEAYSLHGFAPRWWIFTKPLSYDSVTTESLVRPHQETTFDQRGTRFFSYRDQYADLDSTAKYIKFPKDGVFI